jgi:hypothetical protein
MYTIFFTINCVEQLTFYKTFVNQLQFKQLIFFLSKSETAWNTCTADDFLFLTSFHFICQLLDLHWAVDIFVSTSFFELSNFEQLSISQISKKLFLNIKKNNNNKSVKDIVCLSFIFHYCASVSSHGCD